MKNLSKKLLIVLVAMFALVGCGKSTDVSENTSISIEDSSVAAFDGFGLFKFEELSKINFSEKEIAELEKETEENFKASFIESSDMQVSYEQAKQMYEAQKIAFSKIPTPTVEILEGTDEKIKIVKYTFNYINFEQVMSNVVEKISTQKVTTEEEYVDLIINSKIEELTNEQISEETATMKIEFIEEKGIWVPSNLYNFINIFPLKILGM